MAGKRWSMAGAVTARLALLLPAVTAASCGVGPAPMAAKGKAAKSRLAKVKRGPLKIEVAAKGVFEARRMTEVAVHPQAWPTLTVKSAVAPGTQVKKGRLVLALETTRIDEAIEEAERAAALAKVSLKLLEAEVAALEKTKPLDLAAAERDKRAADEDLQRYLKTDRALALKSAKMALERAQDYLDYNREELRQLEKMYKADDLTEETEEIVLKRQRDAVKRAEFNVELAHNKADRETKVTIPRRDAAIRDDAQRKSIALAKAKAAGESELTQARLKLAKQKAAHKQATARLARLKSDRAQMEVRAPAGGIVYYGGCVRGQWPKLSRSLARGTKVLAHEVVMTIVEPAELCVRASVAEKDVLQLSPGVGGYVAPICDPHRKLQAEVESVSAIPSSKGKFEVTLSVKVPQSLGRLVPGMACSAKLLAYDKKDALLVPAAAVFYDDDADKAFVYVRTPGGPAKRAVTVVRRLAAQAEIVGSVAKGDTVLLHKPREEK